MSDTNKTLRELILSKNDLQAEKTNIPEWGVDVYVRPLSSFEYESTKDAKNQRATVVRICCLDERGCQIFQPSDIEALSNKCLAPLHRIYDKVLSMSIASDKKEGVDSPEKK